VPPLWLQRFPHVQLSVPPLSHYTTAEGLLGICTENQLRATCARYSNDLSELAYAQSVAADLIERFFKNRKSTASVDLLKSVFESETAAKDTEIVDAYLISFCESSNLLSQWRAYGKTAGFEIRFESLVKPNALLKGGVLNLNSPTVDRRLLGKVEYDRSRQSTALENIPQGGLEVMESVEKDRPDLSEGPLLVSVFAALETTEWLYTVKHPAFSEEQEWRVVVFPKLTNLFYGGKLKHPDLIKFRTGRHFLVPYLDLAPTEGKLPIAEVICGPGGHHSLTAKAVDLLLTTRGFGNVRVRNSAVPLAL
jgi:Protein of unknown function (DUF2971)